jgi:hypothetical protein
MPQWSNGELNIKADAEKIYSGRIEQSKDTQIALSQIDVNHTVRAGQSQRWLGANDSIAVNGSRRPHIRLTSLPKAMRAKFWPGKVMPVTLPAIASQ